MFVGAPTGDDGRFVIGGLEPGRYRLRVTGPGLLPAEVRFVPGAVGRDADRGRAPGRDRGHRRRRRPAGRQRHGRRCAATRSAARSRPAATCAGGFRFPELPEGRYQVFAWQGALAARAVRVDPARRRTVRAGRAPARGRGDRRRSRDRSRRGHRASSPRSSCGRPATIEAPRYARSGDDGAFRIEGVPNGRWIADAFAPGYLSAGRRRARGRAWDPRARRSRAGRRSRAACSTATAARWRARRCARSAPGRPRSSTPRPSSRTAAAVQRPHGGARADPRRSVGDPQLIARGELGVLVGPIPPIPPPGAQVARPAALDPTIAGAGRRASAAHVDPTSRVDLDDRPRRAVSGSAASPRASSPCSPWRAATRRDARARSRSTPARR